MSAESFKYLLGALLILPFWYPSSAPPNQLNQRGTNCRQAGAGMKPSWFEARRMNWDFFSGYLFFAKKVCRATWCYKKTIRMTTLKQHTAPLCLLKIGSREITDCKYIGWFPFPFLTVNCPNTEKLSSPSIKNDALIA